MKNREIELLNQNIRLALLRMRAYDGKNGDMGYFSLINPVLKKAFELFENGWQKELFSKPYIRGLMSAAFEHAIGDISMNSFIYSEDYEDEYNVAVIEKTEELYELNLDDEGDWCCAMNEYIENAGGLAPGHRHAYIHINKIIGKEVM